MFPDPHEARFKLSGGALRAVRPARPAEVLDEPAPGAIGAAGSRDR
jgi:hypothetical protein